jgi:hypothetical protein
MRFDSQQCIWRTTINTEKMYESDTPDDRPPYMDECEKMRYAQLQRFIERALQKLSDPSVSNEELPRSEEEFLVLCDMLSEKADAENKAAPIPQPPKYVGPDNPGPFTPSDKLRSLYAKRERYQKHADDAYESATYEGGSKVLQEWTEDQLRKMEERDLYPVEQRERRRHAKLVAEYQEARKPYWERYQHWAAEKSRRQEDEANREVTVRRLYREVKRDFGPTDDFSPDRMGTLPFEIAAPGEGTDEHIRGYYREVLRQRRLKGFSQERFDKMLALPRSNWQKGTAGKYGYIVLMFAHTEKVLLECPIYGNAIFVLDSGERRLLEMNKQELIASDEAKRIIHTGDWYVSVKRELGIE